MREWLGVVAIVCACGGGADIAPDAASIEGSVFDVYVAAWSENDDEQRRRMLEYAATETLTVVEPMRTLASRDAVHAAVTAFLRDVPGGTIPITSPVRIDKARAWLTWDVLDGGGQLVFRGTDLMFLAADGRIERVHSFFGELPATGPVDAAAMTLTAAWNEADANARMPLIESSTTEDVRFAIEELPAALMGRAAVSSQISAEHAIAPGQQLAITSGELAVPGAYHHSWRLDAVVDGTAMVYSGVTFARLDDEGKIADASAFYGATP